MKKRDKFIIGGIILCALLKLPNLKEQRFDFAGLFGLIIVGAIFGYIGYLIFGRKRQSAVSPNIKIENMGYKEKKLRLDNEIDMQVTNYASTGKRFLNWAIDQVIMMGLSFALFAILALVGLYPDSLRVFIENGGKAAEYVIGIPIYLFYYFIFESLYQRTPAKFITKTKVLDINGSRPTKTQILKRSLSRLVPFEPLSGFGEKEWHGWHDRWSNTMVVANNYPEFTQEISPREGESKMIPEVSLKEEIKRKTKICPYCGEKILYEATKCQYCKEFLDKNEE